MLRCKLQVDGAKQSCRQVSVSLHNRQRPGACLRPWSAARLTRVRMSLSLTSAPQTGHRQTGRGRGGAFQVTRAVVLPQYQYTFHIRAWRWTRQAGSCGRRGQGLSIGYGKPLMDTLMTQDNHTDNRRWIKLTSGPIYQKFIHQTKGFYVHPMIRCDSRFQRLHTQPLQEFQLSTIP